MLNTDFRDMLSALSDAKAEFLVVGAFALAAYGLPRATGDIDLWVRPTPENAANVFKALTQFGAPVAQISKTDLSSRNIVFQIGLPPRRIDILTSIDGVDFSEAWPSRMYIDVNGIQVPILSKKDFITNKRAVGRPKDIADVAWLEADAKK